MTVRFSSALRAALDSLATDTGITYEYVSDREWQSRAPASAAVRGLLQGVVDQIDDHVDVIRGYGQAVDRVRSALRGAVEAEKGQLAALLRGTAA